MRITRPGALIAGALSALLITAGSANAQTDPYPVTLYFGSGLINNPVAWVSPVNADVRLKMAGKEIPYFNPVSAHNWKTRWNTNISLETHWLGRFTVGATAYSQNPEWGFFGRLLVLRDGDVPFLPSVAVGARNVGRFKHQTRFLAGYDVALNADSSEYVEVVPEPYQNLNTSQTLYAVATKEFGLGMMGPRMDDAGLSLTVGWGNGLFQDDGGIGEMYNRRGTVASGLFFGGRFTAHPTMNTTLHVLAENDAWDWNVGLVGDWRGLGLGIYLSEIEEGARGDASQGLFQVYNYRKWNVLTSYSGNIIDISRGVILRTRITELTREQSRLQREISERERRISALEVALRRAQAGELAEIERRRQELDAQVREERDAIRRAQERLDEIMRGQPTPTPTPPRN